MLGQIAGQQTPEVGNRCPPQGGDSVVEGELVVGETDASAPRPKDRLQSGAGSRHRPAGKGVDDGGDGEQQHATQQKWDERPRRQAQLRHPDVIILVQTTAAALPAVVIITVVGAVRPSSHSFL